MTAETLFEPTVSTPLLGVVGQFADEELRLATEFTRLHNLIYEVGGVRPTNAAIEEVAKLVALRLWATRSMSSRAADLRETFGRPLSTGADALVALAKQGFVEMLQSRDLATVNAAGQGQSLWPVDEPLRLDQSAVLAEAMLIVERMASGPVRVSDPLGTAFDAFLSGKYDHAGGLGTFLTPSAVARMMADLALAFVRSEGDSGSLCVVDPFCGTGRFLAAAYESMVSSGLAEDRLRDALDGGLIGLDQSTAAVAKSGLNLLLLGANAPMVFSVSDSITASDASDLHGQVDVVLTNPPFGGGKYSDTRGIARARAWFPAVKSSSIDPALGGLALSLDLIRPGGIVAIVLPDGIVNGREFGTLLDRDDIHVLASISLPTATFALSGTVAKTSAVFIRKSPKKGRRTVLARVEHVGFIRQAGKAARDPEGNDLPAVQTLVSDAFEIAPGSGVVTLSSAPLVASLPAEGVDNVDPARLDPAATESRASLLTAGGIHLRSMVSSTRPQRRARKDEPFVSVLHVDDFGTTDWTQAERYMPTTPGQIAYAGNILISLLNPSKLRATVIPERYPVVQCSLEFGVFQTDSDPFAILALLYNEQVRVQLRPLGTGTSSSRRRISPADVLDLAVPSVTAEDLVKLGEQARLAIDQVDQGRVALGRLYSAAAIS